MTELETAPLSRRNTGAAEQALRHVMTQWGRARWGDVRVIHELALGCRRCDLAFIGVSDIRVVEIKGPRDNLSDGRLPFQLAEYQQLVPEVWLLVAPKWLSHDHVRFVTNLLIPTANGIEIANERPNKRFEPRREEYCLSRLIAMLWIEEAARIAQRTGVIPGVLTNTPTRKVRAMLCRLLTGNEIIREVCTELRARPAHMTGAGSDPPIRSPK